LKLCYAPSVNLGGAIQITVVIVIVTAVQTGVISVPTDVFLVAILVNATNIFFIVSYSNSASFGRNKRRLIQNVAEEFYRATQISTFELFMFYFRK